VVLLWIQANNVPGIGPYVLPASFSQLPALLLPGPSDYWLLQIQRAGDLLYASRHLTLFRFVASFFPMVGHINRQSGNALYLSPLLSELFAR